MLLYKTINLDSSHFNLGRTRILELGTSLLELGINQDQVISRCLSKTASSLPEIPGPHKVSERDQRHAASLIKVTARKLIVAFLTFVQFVAVGIQLPSMSDIQEQRPERCSGDRYIYFEKDEP